jgi:predicted N-formylglutamate amidohydrolase
LFSLLNEWPHMDEAPNRFANREPPPITVDNPAGTSPFVIVADHAGRYLPPRLMQLGLSDTECASHIAWDIGIGPVCTLLGTALDAVVIRQNYSRLIIDCNRMPDSAESILGLSELTHVSGNIGLGEAHKASRVAEIFQPYHRRIAAELDRRRDAGRPAVLVAMHSFTPIYKGVTRPWQVGVLYNHDRRLAATLMELLRAEPGLVVGDNEPYTVSDATDYTIPVHGEQRQLPHVAVEIRQDLIGEEAGQRSWADLLVRLLPRAYAAFIQRPALE